jgi:alpha-tubulin suppressor-like RCC1 family protein
MRARSLGWVWSATAIAAVTMTVACGGSVSVGPDDGAREAGQTDVSTDGSSDAGPTDAADDGRPEPTIRLFGGFFTLCANRSGTLLCWGSNAYGTLGIGTADLNPHPTPTPVAGFGSGTELAALSVDLACATAGMRASCWGDNTYGGARPPDGGSFVLSPSPIIGLGAVADLAVGAAFACALVQGNVVCWGLDNFGQIGVAPDAGLAQPLNRIATIDRAIEIAAGVDFACARKDDGTVWCWGGDGAGALGQPLTKTPVTTPAKVPLPAGARQVQAALGAVCAVLVDGTVWCWGADNGFGTNGIASAPSGALGHDPATDLACGNYATPPFTFPCDPVPTAVVGLTDARELGMGGSHNCAVKDDDTVVCWGANQDGELGHDPSSDPTGLPDGGDPYDFAPTPVRGLKNVAHVVGGYESTCAVTWDSQVYCWGSNRNGQLATTLDGGATNSFVPVHVTL